MRTVLTGASGYIGLHVTRALLEDGHRVTAVVRSPEKLGPFRAHPRLTVAHTTLEDEAGVAQALLGHDVCIHAALLWGMPGSEFEMRDTAVAAKLFECAGQAGVTRCIYVSSAAVHRPFDGDMHEDNVLGPTDMYGATKAAGELMLRAACATHGMTGIVIRPGPVVGPPAFKGGTFRTPNRLVRLMDAIRAGQPIELDPRAGRQLADVVVVANAIGRLTRVERPHPTYLCLSHEAIPWLRAAEWLSQSLNVSNPVRLLMKPGPHPAFHFRSDRLEALLGGPFDAGAALLAHIRDLADLTKRPA